MKSILFLLCLAPLLVAAEPNPAPKPATSQSAEVKWYPGHYVTLGSNDGCEKWQAMAGKKNFVGGQRIYKWRQLEPELGKYDFRAIEADLALLRGQKQRLILEIWDNQFHGEATPPVPDYLLGAAYQGGIAHPAQHPKGVRTKRWVPAVMERYIALMAALGKRFDSDPHFAGLIHTETATENKGAGFEDFSGAAFHQQMLRLVEASRKAFPHTPVLIFGNYYPYRGPDGLTQLASAAVKQGVGWGGPDLVPGKKIWGYDIIRANAGRMPLGLSAQWDTFKGEWTMQQLLDCATKDLKLNFVFWGCFDRHKTGGLSLTKDVIPAVEAYATSLVTERPGNLNVAAH
jgi:hypothetical protein